MKKISRMKWTLFFTCLLVMGVLFANNRSVGAETKDEDFIISGYTLMGYMGDGGEVTIPDGIVNIGMSAFKNNEKITKVTFPDSVRYIYGGIQNGAFYGCKQLKEVTLNSGLLEIQDNAFYGCDSLTEVTIPASVTNVGFQAFVNCSNLVKLDVENGSSVYSAVDGVLFRTKSVSLMGVNRTDKYLFKYPEGKKGDYIIPGDVDYFDSYSFENCKGLTGITFPKKQFEGLPDSMFKNCVNLTNVTFFDGVTTIPLKMFEGCVKLTNVQLPNTLKEIYGDAFKGCTDLKAIHFKSRVTWINDGAFSGCINLTTFTVDKANARYSAKDGILYNKKITEIVLYPAGRTGKVMFASTVKGIGQNAFQGCTNLIDVKIPDRITRIGSGAFKDCTKLAKIKLSAALTEINTSTFENCTALKTVEIPGYVSEIYALAFKGCENITKMVIPQSVGIIFKDAFEDCDNLVIHGDKKSYAQKYAKMHSFGFIETITKPVKLLVNVKSSAKKKAKVSWMLVEKANGYVVQMSNKKTGFRTIATIKKGKKASFTKTGLKSGKTYYFRARAYKTVNKKTYNGQYSEIIKVKVK